MFETMRKVFGPKIVGAIIGSIAMVFVFYGVFTPKGSQNTIGGNSYAAKVNGEVIPIGDYLQEYKAREQYYAQMFKGNVDPELMKKLGLASQILEDLINRKIVLQESKGLGFLASDVEVREKIQELPYFKKKDASGVEKFDPETYRNLLKANKRSPAEFEETFRRDIVASKISAFIQSLPKVSESELKNEFLVQEDRRQVDYVMMDREQARKRMAIPDKEIDDYLAKKENLDKAKQHYEQKKFDYEKPKSKEAKAAKPTDSKEKPKPPEYFSFEEVKRKVVSDLLKDRKMDEITKINEELSKDVLEKAKSLEGVAFKSYLSSKGLELKTSDKFNKLTPPAALNSYTKLSFDAYDLKSDLHKGPMLYSAGTNYIVALNLKSFAPVDSEFEKKKDELKTQLMTRKSQMMSQEWMGEIRKTADVVRNTSLEKSMTGPAEE